MKVEFGEKPEIYNEFLDIMKNFKVGGWKDKRMEGVNLLARCLGTESQSLP